MKQLEVAVVSIVKEFYANAKEAEDFMVQVRVKFVSFTPESINTYYRLDDIATDDEFTRYYHNELNLGEVIQCLCRTGAKWMRRKEQGAVTFSNKELSWYEKA